ncbi:MAG TPA: SRPBCC family protein [Steroidobacteraceae bacterium]|nr:SRPBCC family protein [Steroidobacteraceae bacterium]
MTSIAIEVTTDASPSAVWDAIRDIGALHTRLVPGFVVATEVVPGGRRVTFANGLVVTEPIVSMNDDLRRLVWTAQGGPRGPAHYNGAVQVFPREIGGSRVVWMADVLPHEAAEPIGAMMKEGAAAMTTALAGLATETAQRR